MGENQSHIYMHTSSTCEAGNGWASGTCPPILSLDIGLLLDCFALRCEVCCDMCSGGGVM